MERLCRVCLTCSPDGKMFPLSDARTREWFEETTSLPIRQENRVIPQQLCTDCYLKCLTCYRFRKQALDSDEKLLDQSTNAMEFYHVEQGEEQEIVVEEDKSGEVEAKSQDTVLIEYIPMQEEEESYPEGEEEQSLSTDAVRDHFAPGHQMFARHGCKFCSKVFPSPSHLARHKLTHSGERPFACEVCGKCFTAKAHLNQHLMIHTEERPFTCEVCAKAFKYQRVLDMHMRTHTDERPFHCPHCDMSFKLRKTLVVHIRTHTGGKSHKCRVCDKTFKHKISAQNHEREAHA